MIKINTWKSAFYHSTGIHKIFYCRSFSREYALQIKGSDRIRFLLCYTAKGNEVLHLFISYVIFFYFNSNNTLIEILFTIYFQSQVMMRSKLYKNRINHDFYQCRQVSFLKRIQSFTVTCAVICTYRDIFLHPPLFIYDFLFIVIIIIMIMIMAIMIMIMIILNYIFKNILYLFSFFF